MWATCGFDNSSENESDKITRLSRMHSSGMHTARLLTVSHGWVSAWGCLCPEMCLPGGVYHTPSPLHAGIHPPPPTEGMTHACENITLTQTCLRAVNITGSTTIEFDRTC